MSGLSQKFSAIYLISLVVMISLACYVNADGQYSDLPPPPTKPDRFTSKQQLKEYLVKLHEYYAIIGRPRFGRSFNNDKLGFQSFNQHEQEQELFNEFSSEFMPVNAVIDILDSNHNGLVTKAELLNFINVFSEQKF